MTEISYAYVLRYHRLGVNLLDISRTMPHIYCKCINKVFQLRVYLIATFMIVDCILSRSL